MGMQLTEENYYSDIANYEYMSVSQFKGCRCQTQRYIQGAEINSIAYWQLCRPVL